uniref:Uncharacterized protein n=1 Tax=Vitis vinifera TaxID=29760 RepID=A5AX98_VITVI|nr:hypothetical protein VITISV_002510 [Vitis vinifera]
MEKHRFASLLIPSIIAFLGLMAFGLCVAAEFKRSKKKDVKLNGKLCYLAESEEFAPGEKSSSGKAKTPWITSTLLVCVMVATSMNRRQPYRRGWLDGKCYIVKDGVYVGSAVLVMLTIGSTLGSVIMTGRKSQVEQGRRIHAQQHK